MASMRGGGLLDMEPLIRVIRDGGFLNSTLKAICAAENLKQSGVKSELQSRIIDRIRSYAASRNLEKFETLRNLINHPPGTSAAGSPYSGIGSSSPAPARTMPTSNAYLNGGNSINAGFNMGGGANGYPPYGGQRGQKGIDFKPSPFFKVEQQLGDIMPCEIMQHHRHTVTIRLRASEHSALQRIRSDPTLKIMVFCAGDNNGRQEIAFPHQSEIKVNTNEMKANLRGLKNKPGSTRPVDITKELRVSPLTYQNIIEMTYALTVKAGGGFQKFYLVVYAVRLVPVDDLVERLKNGQKITERAVLDDMVTKSRDADIVATASVLSLKCPLSTLRIDLPCRSISCRHNQCFDATSYLQLQEQGPTWLCPICNRSAPFESLAVDEYVKNILANTPTSADQVTVQPTGSWELHSKKENAAPTNGVASDDDDDLVEVTKNGDSVTMGTPQPYGATVSSLIQESVSASYGLPGSTSSAKRPISDVIDLTSSGDEDEAPPSRAPKRQHTNHYSTSPSLPTFRPLPSNGYPH